jgi:DNA-binding response OmpR family regulator
MLEQTGFLVDYYYNPILALDEFKSNFYDLIIRDIKMPNMNGFES